MREAWLPLTIDAEEQDKLDLSLALVEPLLTDPALAGWNGLGLAVQAYGKRALPLIDWLAPDGRAPPGGAFRCGWSRAPIGTARSNGRRKRGLAGYPVFTRKVNTDVAYLAAARALLARARRHSSRNSPPTTPTPSPP